jgi:hypothetical protein
MLAGVTGSKLGLRAGAEMPLARDVVGISGEGSISTCYPALIILHSSGLVDTGRLFPMEVFGR